MHESARRYVLSVGLLKCMIVGFDVNSIQDPILGVVSLKLSEALKNGSCVCNFYSIAGGIG